ncbi:MAG: ABC transporter ATP-binding protein [Coriobacteriia bacterium]|nr:ABC transporter ATP-binding protein [Coriobacteriia bacterium]
MLFNRQQHNGNLKKSSETRTQNISVEEADSDAIIEFSQVSKVYRLYKNERSRFLSLIGIRRKGTTVGVVNANDELSFIIRRGEAVAFLGQNGAGKSTALKIIAGVSHPTSGTVHIKGRVSALLDLKAGFDGRLTGRENISLRGQALGLTRAQIKDLEPTIIKFADLGLYIDQPMRTYSKGMKARLGFAFAVSINPEILIVDETLSVGDRRFKKKCVRRMREIITDENVTVLFVTHASEIAREFCTRGIVLDQGKKVFDGPISEAIAFYESNF